LAIVSTIAFPIVDIFDCSTEALLLMSLIVPQKPCPKVMDYGRMAVIVLHTEPHGCLERNGSVLPHLLWVIQPVEPNALPRRSMIVILACINKQSQ
jgi:hypothetical protein